MKDAAPATAVAMVEAARDAYRAGRHEEAIAGLRAAGSAGAADVTVFNDIGVALNASRRSEAAVSHFRRVLVLEPEAPEAWANLANALRRCGRYDEAAAAALTGVRLAPDDPEILAAAGVALRQAGDDGQALGLLERATAAAPENAIYGFERAVTLLTLGRMREGFRWYENRLATGGVPARELQSPAWKGEPLGDRDILIHAEQGQGDMIQFARFAPRVRALTRGRVWLECYDSLERLFRAIDPAIEIVGFGTPLPPHDLHVSIMSLPHVLDLDQDDLAVGAPYMKPPPDAAARDLLDRRARVDGPRIGLTWAGNRNNQARTCPFDRFLGVVEVPGATYYSLQRGDDRADIERFGAGELIVDLADDLADFADDAAVVQALDLVITIDTAFCHLAAAVSRPTWTLLPYVADWRFGRDPATCPWYPTMRLFRQQAPGDWSHPTAAVRAALERFVRDWRAARGLELAP